MRFSLNIERFVNQILPFILRKGNRVKLFQSLLKPVQTLFNEFMAFRAEVIFKTKYSSQQKSLSALLNKKFDGVHRRIRIITATDLKTVFYRYNSDEVNPAPAYSFNSDEANPFLKFSYNSNELNNPYRFIVRIPADCNTNEIKAQIKSWVDYYRFSSMNFIFQVI